LVLLATPGQSAPQPPDPPKTLSAEDKKFLDELMAEFLFDPKGAERVRFGDEDFPRTVWLVKGKSGEKDRVFFTDGCSIPAPDNLEKDDFVDAYRALKKSETLPEREYGTPETKRLVRRSLGVSFERPLARAAWLYRLGHEADAAVCLAMAREQADDFSKSRALDDKPPVDARTLLRTDLAWQAFREMIDAFQTRSDAESLARGERTLKLFSDLFASERGLGQTKSVVAELNRRKQAGKSGKEPAKAIPIELWKDTSKKIAWLIDALDEVDAQQHGSPGGVDLGSDWRVKALIAVRDPAVPALIAVIENDERLTHSVHFWRDYDPHRTVLSVREAALVAVMSILRVQVFDPAFTGDNFTSRGDETHKETAAKLRAYWAEFGRFPFDERMMKILTDPKSSSDACQEAADNLATLGSERVYGTTVWTDLASPRPADKPNPAIAKFKDPTVAEAVLKALDRDLKALAGNPVDEKRRSLLGSYLSALGELGDQRIGPTLAGRAKTATDLAERRMYAISAFDCGAKEPMRVLAEEVKAGTLKLPAADQSTDRKDPAGAALTVLVQVFLELRSAETDAALTALGDLKHPYRKIVVREILGRSPDGEPENNAWFAHPFTLAVLRQLLDDSSPTPAGRTCDQAALRVGDVIIGMPEIYSTTKDPDPIVRVIKGLFDRHRGHLIPLTDQDVRSRLGNAIWGKKYYPRIVPLAAPATAADVAAGRAVFHLAGEGTVVPVKPRTWVVLKTDAKQDHPPQGLVVQAEKNEKGQVTYGVIFRHTIRSVSADEVDVMPEEKPDGRR
jgi:hypothetical protein